MPYRLDTHVLTVDANVIHKVDTANLANLFSIWTGRRLENLSWRLWQREQLLEKSHQASPVNTLHTTPTMHSHVQDVPFESKLLDMPQLSGSVESVQDEEAVEFTSVSAPLAIRPRIRRLESSSSRSKRDRHISSDFEKMIVSIVKDKAPLSAPTRTSTLTAPSKPLPLPATATMVRSGSTTSESQSPSKHSDQQSEASHASPPTRPVTNVVRGFSPPTVSISMVQTAQISAPDSISQSMTLGAPRIVRPQKQPATFALGGASCSPLSEQEQSADKAQPALAASIKKPVFQIGGSSSEEGSLKSALLSPRLSSAPKKQASFSNQVDTRTIAPSESAIDSDAEYVDESAIDDDSSDWEDSVEDSNKSSVDEKFFQRVPSKATLTSRPSLITLMLAQDERAKKLSNQSSQSKSTILRQRAGPSAPSLAVSPNDSDEGPLMMKGMRHSTLNPISEIPRSGAQPISVGAARLPAQAALSPRTTRRNMLATELTESLRRHLLWERQQKSSTANAVLKRRHTAHDVASLKQFPVRPCLKNVEEEDYLNKVFSKEALNNYHSKGW